MKNREIIDNSEGRKLVTFLKNKLEENKDGFDVATAFFNIEAFSMVKDELEGVERFRLLLGKSPEFDNDRTLGDEIRDYMESDVEGLEFSRENLESVEELIEFLGQDKVEVRLYKKNFLHGKAYIWDDEVVIGSSNFTAAGLTTNNELNGIFKTPSRAEHTREEWFEKFWEDADQFNEALKDLLEESRFGSKEYTPYQVFMKTLYEYQREDLTQDLDSEGRQDSEIDLTEFQEDAVKRVFTRMRKYGGCMVADSVGLGKTYIAKRMIEEFGSMRKKNYLIVSPASLEDMWEKEMKDLNMSENILSQEAVARDNWERKAEKATGGNLEDVELVVVDESHNFRNPKSNRWEHLFTILDEKIKGDDNKPYVLFLTATPINNSIWDLYWQLMLMLEHNRAAFIKEGITDLYDKFQKAEDAGDPTLLNDVLNEISVRRTREYIVENYPESSYTDDEGNEKTLNFPDRELDSISYALDDSYQGYFKEISQKIKEDLTMAYYRQLDYKDKKELTQDEEMEKGRMKGMQGIFETLLLKRLESSVGAFKESIDSHIEFLEETERYLDKGKILSKSGYNKYTLKDQQDDISEEKYRGEFKDADLDEYNTEDLKSDIRKDIEVFRKIKNLIKDIGYEEDAKIQKLEEELYQMSRDDQIVVFAFYSDTIKYIYDYLSNSDRLSDKRVEMITGDSSTDEREEKIEAYREGDIDIILSTDVLSEGQNLQKAKHLINYDLHWNPTRMIQRAGRIDRIGTPHNTIVIHNFFPSDELEELLKLVQVLEDKISDIDDAVGMDQKVLDEDINPKVFGTTSSLDGDTLKRIRENDNSVIDELSEDTLGGGEGFWQPIKRYMDDKAREELEKIPNGIYSGHKEDARGIFFYYQYGEDFHYWYFCDLENNQLIENKSEILDIISADKETERKIPDELFDKVYNQSDRVRDEIETAYKQIEQSSSDDSKSKWDNQRSKKFLVTLDNSLKTNIADHMKRYRDDEESAEQIKKIRDKLRKITLTKSRTSDIRSLWRKYRGERGHGDWKKLADDLEEILEDKSESDVTELEEYDGEKLSLITVEFIS